MTLKEKAVSHALRYAGLYPKAYMDAPDFQPHDWVVEAVRTALLSGQPSADPVVEANRVMLKERSDFGIQKYGHMLTRPDLGLRDWLQHALEESLDQANYLQAAIRYLDAQATTLKEEPIMSIATSQPYGGANPAPLQLESDGAAIAGPDVLQTSFLADDHISTYKMPNDLVITPDDYQRLACRTAPPNETQKEGLVHCALGLTTEAGEYTTEVKRVAIYGRDVTEEMRLHMIEELGDTLWYIALACAHLDIKLGQVMQQNIDKLRKRFPGKFTEEAAEARADKGGVDARHS